MKDVNDYFPDEDYCDKIERIYGSHPKFHRWKSWGKIMSYTLFEAFLGPLKVDKCNVTDIDWFIDSWRTNKCMFIEQKNRKAKLKDGQSTCFGLLDKSMQQQTDREYLGYWLLTFENSDWDDGYVEFQRLEFKDGLMNGTQYFYVQTTDESKKKKITRQQFQEFLKEQF